MSALLGLLLLLRIASAQGLTILNAPVGGRVQMVPVYRGDPQGFEWKKGPNKIIEVDFPGKPQHYLLKDRSKLNLTTGILTISDLQHKDSGSYTADVLVNGFYQHTAFQLLLFPALNKPTVTCSDTNTGFLFRCHHEPDPPTYEWFHGGKPVADIPNNYNLTDQNRSLTVGHADRESLKSLECVVKNPATENRTSAPETCYKKVSAQAVTTVNAPVGGRVQMAPVYHGDPQGFEWKKGPNKIIEVDFPGEPQHYALKDRSELSLTTGVLTISDLEHTDAGSYTADVLVNGFYQHTAFQLIVFHPTERQRSGPIPVWGIVLLTLLLILLLFLVIIYVCTEGVIIIITYEGKSVEMTPVFKGDPKSIEWKKGEDTIIKEEFVNKDGTDVELMKERCTEKDLLAGPQHAILKDRSDVNLKTGALTIRDLQPTDSGIYTANVLLNNGKCQKTTFDLRFSPPAKHDDRLDLKEKRKKKRRYNFNRKNCLNHRTGVLTISD